MATARADAGTEVDAARGQATVATRADFGEHAIAPAPDPSTLTATTTLAAAPAVDAPAAEAPALPAEMWAGVDAQAQAPLAAKLTAERDRYAAGRQQFETDRDAARADADGKVETLEADAATEQAAARDTAQAEVDTAREDWRAEVDQVEADARADADAAQAEHTTQIEQERTTADTEAAGHLTQAEKDAAAKTADAEEAAAAKKQEGEKESGGFWGWVKSKAKAFIDGIKSAVNAIYDGLRAAVKAVFEAAKALALAVIEAARKVIVGLIKALGGLLKAIVKVALAAFPKLADKFCALIDAAVDKATTLVNTIADGLKTAVTAVLDFLASTLDKILSIVQDLYNAAFTLIGMLITGEWKAIVEGLGNLVAAAETAPGQFEAAALEELLGGDLDQPLDHATLIAAGRTPPGMAEGEGMASATDAADATEATEATDAETPRPPWTEANVGVDAVAHDYPLSPELMADIEARLGGAESIEFGHSDDPDRNLSTLLGQDAAAPQQTEGATKTAPTPDDGLSPRERADVKWTLMKQGLAQWWSDNWPLVLAGGVLAIGGFIAANILTGGAVLAALPGLMTALGAVFAGVTAVHLAGHLRDYLQKGWAGDTQGGGKSLAKALAAAAVELLTWLTFKVGSVALKGAKTVAKGVSKGAQSLAKGASRAGKAIAGGVRRAGQYVIKQGKVLLKGIAGTALGRAAKRLDDFARGMLGKTRFKGFRMRVQRRWFILEGKINPYIPLAEIARPKPGDLDGANEIAEKVPEKFKKRFMCKDFSKAMEEALKRKGIKGARIEIDTGAMVYSDAFGALGDKGMPHWAIRVGDTVFDNFRTSGVDVKAFFDDLGGDLLFNSPLHKVTQKPF